MLLAPISIRNFWPVVLSVKNNTLETSMVSALRGIWQKMKRNGGLYPGWMTGC